MTPYVIEYLAEPRSQISVFFGMAGVAFLAGSIIAGTIVHKLGVYKTSLAGVFLIMSSGMLLLIVYWLDGLSYGAFLVQVCWQLLVVH